MQMKRVSNHLKGTTVLGQEPPTPDNSEEEASEAHALLVSTVENRHRFNVHTETSFWVSEIFIACSVSTLLPSFKQCIEDANSLLVNLCLLWSAKGQFACYALSVQKMQWQKSYLRRMVKKRPQKPRMLADPGLFRDLMSSILHGRVRWLKRWNRRKGHIGLEGMVRYQHLSSIASGPLRLLNKWDNHLMLCGQLKAQAPFASLLGSHVASKSSYCNTVKYAEKLGLASYEQMTFGCSLIV